MMNRFRWWFIQIHARARAFSYDEDGGAFLEFAIFGPLLIAMLLGATQIGLLALQETQLHGIAEAGVLSAIKYTTNKAWNDTNSSTQVTNDMRSSGIATPSATSASCFYGCPNSGLTDIDRISGYSCDTTVTKNPPNGTCTGLGYDASPSSAGDAPGQYASVSVSLAANSILGRGALSWLPTTLSQTMTVMVK
jgi:Flp pilus assembly protein TadG